MTGDCLIAGDFSGIQSYVLGITGGAGQAKRLRARSFLVQILSEIVVGRVVKEFGERDSTILVHGGGQFLLRVPAREDADRRLSELRNELEENLFTEFGGQLGFSLAWASTAADALERKDRAKRRPWAAAMQGPDWREVRMSGGEIGDPCEYCEKASSTGTIDDDGEKVAVCGRCKADLSLGRQLPHVRGVLLGGEPSDFQLLGTGVKLQRGTPARTAVPLARHVPSDAGGKLLTFDQIERLAKGDALLGFLKADVDGMGKRVSQLVAEDPSYGRLRELSARLERFFSEEIQHWLELEERFHSVYTVYSGGDDLLLIGPWNVILDLTAEIHIRFRSEFGGREHDGLTISAGVAFARHGLPVRYAVDRAEELLELAKSGNKNKCATLGGVFEWKQIDKIRKIGRRIQQWIDGKVCSRGLIRRLYELADSERLDKAGLWAYQVGRNLPPRDASGQEAQELRKWGEATLDLVQGTRMPELAATLLYALTATREQRDHETDNDHKEGG